MITLEAPGGRPPLRSCFKWLLSHLATRSEWPGYHSPCLPSLHLLPLFTFLSSCLVLIKKGLEKEEDKVKVAH